MRHSRNGPIDGGEGRGVRLGGTDIGAPPTGWARRPRHPEYFDDDETLIQDPAPENDYSTLDEEADSSPEDRRRDPLRNKF